jgi:hypothetical protein
LAVYTKLKRGRKGAVCLNNTMRPLCKCGLRPRAVNYKKNNRIYYRSLCEICMAHGLNHGIPRWVRAGYQLKSQCDKCGFRSPHKEVFRVFHVDGELNNCRPANLKTVCACCVLILAKEGITWKQGDLIADF